MDAYSISITIIAILAFLAFLALFIHGDYKIKILIKLGLKEKTAKINWAIYSWENCLNKLDYRADIAFLGDSITQGSDFHKCFKSKKIINLGHGGDSIDGITKRVNMAKAVSAQKLFLLGGINSLNNNNLKLCVKQYDKLLKTVQELVPDTEVYVQSVLPVLDGKKLLCNNSTIKRFNSELKRLSEVYGATFIDLYSVFVEDGKPNAGLYHDNVHINKRGYEVWSSNISEYIE